MLPLQWTYHNNPELQVAIDWATDVGIVGQTFDPYHTITRYEFAQWLVWWAEKEGREMNSFRSCEFDDTDSLDIDSSVTRKACEYGYFQGYNGSFMVRSSVTYADALTVLIRSLYGVQPEGTLRYSEYVKKAQQIDLTYGITMSNVMQAMTRGELLILLKRAIDHTPYEEMRVTDYDFMDDGSFSYLLMALEETNLLDDLLEESAVTLLAPNNAAFLELARSQNASIETLFSDTEMLRQILLFHVVPGQITSDSLKTFVNGEMVPTIEGQSIRYSAGFDQMPSFNGATIVRADLMDMNLTIHEIDQVMMPEIQKYTLYEAVTRDRNLSFVRSLIGAANFSSVLLTDGPYTLFLPSDAYLPADFEELVMKLTTDQAQWLLSKHMVSGIADIDDFPHDLLLKTVSGDDLIILDDNGTIRVNGVNVVGMKETSNGVVYYMDGLVH